MTRHLTPKESLQHYFDELLNGEDRQVARITVAEPAPTSYAEPDNTRQQKLARLLQTAQPMLVAVPVVAAVIEEIQEWEIAAPVAELPAEAPVYSGEDETAAAHQMEGLEWLENGRPPWAQTRFDVLLFQ